MERSDPKVIVVGGGPAGLVLSIELGRRGVPCLVLDRGTGTPRFPKANSTTSRTMEHYRRLGISEKIRQIGLPDDYSPDVSYHTRYAEYELARLHWPSRAEALADRLMDNAKWPTPEPMHRGQQMFIEPLLKEHAETLASVDLRFGWLAAEVREEGERVAVVATNEESGETQTFTGDYVVGCEGPRSLVRGAMDTRYEGFAGESRDFLGGRMMATFLDAPAFYEEGPQRESWQYWCINRERRGIMMAIDGKGLFAFHTQLPEGQEPSIEFARESFDLLMGKRIHYEIKGVAEWTAGFTLVVEKMSKGRMFLAGDAAHLFTPTAGLGYNTSVDDAANLGWKLAAVINGWGGPDLLATYEDERKPIARRNTAFARSMAEFFRHLNLPDALEQEGPVGEAARAKYGAKLHEFAETEFAAPGIILGAFYTSDVIMSEDGPPPHDAPNFYIPHASPGGRAPHVWMPDGRALFDLFGPDFTLLSFNSSVDLEPMRQAAQDAGVPLSTVVVEHAVAHELYAADVILIRPDQHIAWRGSSEELAERAALIVAVATGTVRHRLASPIEGAVPSAAE